MFQFTTGSVEDRQRHAVHVTVKNAGIQAANVRHLFRKLHRDRLESVIERTDKIPPGREAVILDVDGLNDVHCELILTVDSPTLIVTVIGETRYPLHCRANLVDEISAPYDRSAPSRSLTLLWSYTSKGDPF